MPEAREPDPRVYFAAERTFLAWIRTGLALMGFGFVVAKFGVATHYSQWIGVALIGIGVALTAGAATMHVKTIHRLNRGEPFVGRPTGLGIVLAVLLIGIGALMILYLGSTVVVGQQRGPAPDPLIREGVTHQYGPHTYVIPDGGVGLVPNVGIVVGSRATLVIDPGLGRRNGETVLKEVAKVSRNAELYIASTHFHAEHTTGYIAFPATAKYINSTVQEAEFAEGGMQMVQMFSGRSPATAEILKDAARRTADVTFDREYRLDLGGVHVKFVVVGPTHTKGDTGLFVEEDKVLFAGDVVMNESFLAASAVSSMKAWMAAFDTFEALKPETVVPSHGLVGAGALVAANRAVMSEIQTRAAALKRQGRSVEDATTEIQQNLVAQHPSWPRANGIAAAARTAFNEAN